jgi:hypothetical protein
MGGGLMQLVAYGAQDIYLTGNPQITFWKVVYRRHTNFARESIEQTWDGSATANGRCSATISRNGDLLSRCYLEVVGTSQANTNGNNPGCSFIQSLEVQIGGQQIDKHTGKWMEAWAELTEPNPMGTVEIQVAENASGNGTLFQNMSGMGGVVGGSSVAGRFHVPLQFWFCRNPGLALPLIALQYHEVKIIMEHMIATVFASGISNSLWCEYIYLDTDERRRFAQVSHEYLIEQVQSQDLANASGSQDLILNHPVKELIWTTSEGANTAVTATSLVPVVTSLAGTFQLKLNGHDRFAARDYTYFSRVQVYEHHKGHGGLDSGTTAAHGGSNDSICVYSFALEPEEHQPSGTCNFSRIDTAQLVSSETVNANTTLFAVNYNVLRIMSGMGGLAYSN